MLLTDVVMQANCDCGQGGDHHAEILEDKFRINHQSLASQD